MRILFLLVLAPLLTRGQSVTERIGVTMRDAATQGFSGVVLAADHGKIFFHKSYGYRDFATQAALGKDDVFELASVSKQFTAMIIMMLNAQKKLAYEDPVSKYLSIPYPHITIRQLLNHTSGLPDYQAIMDAHWDKSKVASNKDILAYLNQFAPPKLFEPGARFEYSNTGYVLLGSIAEAASGEDFIALCRKWIFKPLQMKSTDIRTLQEKAQVPHFAVGHIYVPEKGAYIRADSFPSSNYTIWLGNRKGPGRISATARDLLRWDQALYTNKLVPQETLRQAFQPATLSDGSLSYYGFGWMLEPEALGTRMYHTGDNPGYATKIIRHLDTQRTLIILCNNAYAGMEKLATQLETLIQQ